MVSVTPRCKQGTVEPYISAHGYFFPCCWIANEPHVSQLKNWLGADYEQLNIKQHDISEITESAAIQRLERSWRNGTFRSCIKFCGKPYDPNEPIARDRHLAIDFETQSIDEW